MRSEWLLGREMAEESTQGHPPVPILTSRIHRDFGDRMAPARSRAGIRASRNNAHEALVQFPLIVEDRVADLVDRPDALGVVRVIDEPAREHLVAVAGRVEEIDRLAAGDAVPGQADIERDVVTPDDIGRLADLNCGGTTGLGYWAIKPPSITSSAPVTNEASSEARNSTP